MFLKVPSQKRPTIYSKVTLQVEKGVSSYSQKVELVIKQDKTSLTTVFKNNWQQRHTLNIEEPKLTLLKQIKKGRKNINIATDI